MDGIILAHGGAGDIPDSRVEPKLEGLRAAVIAGYRALIGLDGKSTDDGASLHAAAATVAVMEDHWAFNAGYGSVLNEIGKVEMDAAVMEGRDLNYGGVMCIENIKNPILVAEKVATSSRHCLFAGEGAVKFAVKQGFELLPEDALISPQARETHEKFLKRQADSDEVSNPRNQVLRSDEGIVTNELAEEGIRGTVGAVVIDKEGHLAAATSTGGLVGNAVGRVGDSPIIGAGLYADNDLGAVSTTGIGEALLRSTAAHKIALAMGKGESADRAIAESLSEMTKRVGGDGGAISLSKNGEIGIEFNSRRMAWAYIKVSEADGNFVKVHSGCNRGQHFEHLLRV